MMAPLVPPKNCPTPIRRPPIAASRTAVLSVFLNIGTLWAVAGEKFELSTAILEMPLAERFTIATETWDVARSLFVLLRFGDETGVGEVQPSERWDDSPDSVKAELDALD